MLGGFLRTLFDDSRRGDDRAGEHMDLSLPSGKPPVLRRRTTNLIALLGIIAILYGTLMPFQIDHSKALLLATDLDAFDARRRRGQRADLRARSARSCD